MFYKLSWNIQLISAVVLFVGSFYFESTVLLAYITSPVIAIGVSAALECSKVFTIVLSRYFRQYQQEKYPRIVAFWTLIFRTGLILFSLAATLMFFGKTFDRPYLDAVKQQDSAQVRQQYDIDKQSYSLQLLQLKQQDIPAIRLHYETLIEQRGKDHRQTLTSLEPLLTSEMDNVINGNFIGQRYKAIEVRLDAERQRYRDDVERLIRAQKEEVTDTQQRIQTKVSEQLTTLRHALDAKLKDINDNDYHKDRRVEHPITVATERLLNELSPWRVNTIQISFSFALILSILLELGIFVTIEHITITYCSIFTTQDEFSKLLRQRKTEVQSELKDYKIHDLASVNRLKHWLKQLNS